MLRGMMVLILTALAACTAPADRFVVPAQSPEARQRIGFATVELRDVTLPAYAAADEIARLDAEGKVVSDGTTLWADTPDRAINLELSRLLSQMSGARIASAPWPFETPPEARMDLRFETLLAGADGQFRARGQYFVAVVDARERSGLFDLSVPYAVAAGPQAIAAARGQIMADLARFLARDGLR